MVEKKKYEPLKENHFECKLENNDEQAFSEEWYCKKHGVWCKLKSRLRLSEKGKQNGDHLGQTVECSDKSGLIAALSNESLSEDNEEFGYRGRNVSIAILPDKYMPLFECDPNCRDDDSHFCEISHPIITDHKCHETHERLHDEDSTAVDDKTPKINKDNNNNNQKTVKKILVKKWRGKKAKRVRKGIRHCTRCSFQYLQVGASKFALMFPDGSTIVTAAIRSQKQDYRR